MAIAFSPEHDTWSHGLPGALPLAYRYLDPELLNSPCNHSLGQVLLPFFEKLHLRLQVRGFYGCAVLSTANRLGL